MMAIAKLPRLDRATLQALAMGIPAIVLGLQLSAWFFSIHVILEGRVDFRQLYTAGRMVREGAASQLYDLGAQKIWQDRLVSPQDRALPFNHAAYEALLFAPLTFFSYLRAFTIFLAVNIALLYLSYRCLRADLMVLNGIWVRLPRRSSCSPCFLPRCGALGRTVSLRQVFWLVLGSSNFKLSLRLQFFFFSGKSGGLLKGLECR
jgi:hypothetical protein